MSCFPATIFASRRYAVVGLGRAGLSAMRALTDMGATVVGWDDAPFARDAAQRARFTVQDPATDIGDYDALVLSPGIPHSLPAPHRIATAAITAGCPILTDAELLYEAVRASGSHARFVGITGTNGKSTTTALLAHILTLAGVPNAAGANLGPASLSLPLLPDHGVYVLEMSSYMLERLVNLRFDIAVMLNLSPDHLDRHGNMAGYQAAKMHIFDRQTQGNIAIVGVDDPASEAIARSFPKVKRISGCRPASVFADGSRLISNEAGQIVDLRDARALPGMHNAQNAAAAAAAALSLGVSSADIARGIEVFPGLAHRQETVGNVDGVSFVNDSKATNADATARALGCYERIIWIAGGLAKSGGIEALAPHFFRVAAALLIGRDADLFADTLKRHGVAHTIVHTLDRAVPQALMSAGQLGAGVVLLSPACASFDQFSGFEERGACFTALVRALPHGVA